MAASIPTSMQALVSNLPASTSPAISMRTKPVPTPARGSVLIQLRASGLNASDAANALSNRFRRPSPVTVGRDFAGVIVCAPSDPALVGQRVFGSSGDELSLTRDGTMAQYLCVPSDAVARMPASASFAQAGQMGTPYTTAYVALLQAGLGVRGEGERQQSVLVLAATGAVGRAATQIARARGHRVITASRRGGMDVNVSEDPALAGVAGLTEGRGVDVVVDAAGDPGLAAAALAVLGRGGRFAVVTSKRGNATQVNFAQLYSRAQSIVGVYSAALNLVENQRALQEIADLVDQGKIQLDPEDRLEIVKFSDAVEIYPKAMAFDGKKYVFVFDE